MSSALPATAIAWSGPPSAVTASSSVPCLRAVMQTFAPSATSRSAMPRPMPRLAPVTTATLSSNLLVMTTSPGSWPCPGRRRRTWSPDRTARRETAGVDQGARDPGAGHAEGVTDRDGSAVDVELVEVDAQVVRGGNHLCGERLVDLDQVDVVDGCLLYTSDAADE